MKNDKTLQNIIEHGNRDYPNEACGLVIDTSYGYQAIPCVNQSHEPDKSFLIDPLLYVQYADRLAAIYHTHPDHSPTPSAADIASAERCAVPFLIVSIPSEEIYTYTPVGTLPAPYEGRSFVYGVMDCLSLVTDYYLHELGIRIDDGERKRWQWWADSVNNNAMLMGFIKQGFHVVSDLQPNDLILFSLGGYDCPRHVAIYMGNNKILHHPAEGTNSRVEMFGQFWRQAVACYLRYEKN